MTGIPFEGLSPDEKADMIMTYLGSVPDDDEGPTTSQACDYLGFTGSMWGSGLHRARTRDDGVNITSIRGSDGQNHWKLRALPDVHDDGLHHLKRIGTQAQTRRIMLERGVTADPTDPHRREVHTLNLLELVVETSAKSELAFKEAEAKHDKAIAALARQHADKLKEQNKAIAKLERQLKAAAKPKRTRAAKPSLPEVPKYEPTPPPESEIPVDVRPFDDDGLAPA